MMDSFRSTYDIPNSGLVDVRKLYTLPLLVEVEGRARVEVVARTPRGYYTSKVVRVTNDRSVSGQ